MIKIEIKNFADKEQEYIDTTLDVVLNRINILKKSIDHLRGIAIDFEGVSFKSLKTITKSIIKLIDDTIIINLDGRANYTAQVTNYIANANDLAIANLDGLNDLLNNLISNDNFVLKELLKCKPNLLSSLNNILLTSNNIANIDLSVLKLAFNYQEYDEISRKIKNFFRGNNFVKYCPYCNIAEVEFRSTTAGRAGTTHELDHFFDKATFPLLSYSMYNLVPSDSTCNGINKGSYEFTDDFHLNPYSEGFGNSINFIPIIIGSKIKVTEITIRINEIYATRKYNQLIGNNHEVNEDDVDGNGNVNVFKLLTKYRDRTRKAEKILNTIQKIDKGIRSSGKFLRLLNPTINKKVNYLKWYHENIDTPFKYNEFNNEAYSKFNRDIHDYYYSINQNLTNHYIRDLINENND